MDRWVPELFLISLLAAFCGGLAWIHDHELFSAAFSAAEGVAASQARPRCRAGVRDKKVAKASEMAAQEIDRLIDPSTPDEERQRRKRRLIKGPKEFRDVRSNRPKFK